ncbi:MAG: Membrane protein [uncultured Nocardioides sp.]|uniref:Membrane protein n=1 Tax=uncultured Nocardioides sp. TaxID=198441 RepID=A0A6J4NUK7_9ACTN|nr:MAG: Membrane protein [uncultured Nocardioides sp.]
MRDWFGLIARLVTGGVWIVAGALKLPHPGESVRAVRAYDLLPEAVVPTVGHLLPVVEVVVGACLVLGLLTRAMAAVSAVLLLAFIVGIASAWARGLSIDCGCFGGGGRIQDAAETYPVEIARDAGLLALSAWLVVRPRTRLALDSLLFRSSYDDPEGTHDGDEEEPAGQGSRGGQAGGPAGPE